MKKRNLQAPSMFLARCETVILYSLTVTSNASNGLAIGYGFAGNVLRVTIQNYYSLANIELDTAESFGVICI